MSIFVHGQTVKKPNSGRASLIRFLNLSETLQANLFRALGPDHRSISLLTFGTLITSWILSSIKNKYDFYLYKYPIGNLIQYARPSRPYATLSLTNPGLDYIRSLLIRDRGVMWRRIVWRRPSLKPEDSVRSNGVGLGVGVWSPVYGYGQYLMGIARALVDVDKVMSDGTARVEVSGGSITAI